MKRVSAMRIGRRRLASALLLCLVLAGCATPGSTTDPLEPMNRVVFAFNEKVDEVVLTPVARGYRALFPEFVRTGVTNMFSNLEDVWIGVNNLLQGKVREGAQDFTRVTWNSTLGILGFFDVATAFELPKHNEDFGQTLGWYGVGTGPYLVLPLFGPSDFRDGAGFSVDSLADIVRNLDDVPTRNTLYGTRAINTRTNLLDASQVLEQAALDKYRFMRDAYLQRRRSLVYDGNPPLEDEFEDDESTEKPAKPDTKDTKP
jgi:phospholipid-binding lipoprotein MlaA